MADRVILRIASQHIGNWLVHCIVMSGQVEKAIHGMATIVDAKNADVPGCRPLQGDMGGPAYRAAQEMVFEGAVSPVVIRKKSRTVTKKRCGSSRAGVLAA